MLFSSPNSFLSGVFLHPRFIIFVEWLVQMDTFMWLRTVARGWPKNWGCRLPLCGSRFVPDLSGRTHVRYASWGLPLWKVHPVSRPFFYWRSILCFSSQIINFSPQLGYNSRVIFCLRLHSCLVIQGSSNIARTLASGSTVSISDPMRCASIRIFSGVCMLGGGCHRCSDLSISFKGSVRRTRRGFSSRTPWGEANYRLRALGWWRCSRHLDIIWSQGLFLRKKYFPTDDANWRCLIFHVRKAD